ncbi:MAG: hypothetical protein CMF96_09580 [Candidatus Marinimicrobia bacterium]|nr:hypothetical protein [Candidatus Neomarinimicrobiota bacterium]|tara:strand:- start:4654 stop:5334 length:681 start_codon:yes stop_codon:yes gene_type:complete
MKFLKLISGILAIFLASIGVSFMVLSQNTPAPEPKSPEDIVWEFLIKDKPMNPEVLKNKLISYKRNLRNLKTIQDSNKSIIDSLMAFVGSMDSIYIAKLNLKDSLYTTLNDSLSNEITILTTNLNLKNVQITDSQHQLDLLNQQLEVSNAKKVDLEEKQENLKSLAKTYEAMKLKDMASILKNVDDNTVMRIYFEMKPKKRQNLLLALDQKRAANITRKLAVIEQS